MTTCANKKSYKERLYEKYSQSIAEEKWIKYIEKNPAKWAKRGWMGIKEKTKRINEIYSKKETRDKLLKDNYYKTLFGRAKNRTLQKTNLKLYKSIYENTKVLDVLFEDNPHQKTFTNRLIFICEKNYNINKLKCKCGKKYSWSGYCRVCKPNYPSKEYFKTKYKENWEKELNKDKHMRKKLHKGQCNKKWFKNKFGKNWEEHYRKHYEQNFNVQNNRYSKISQQLFWEIYKRSDIKNCNFAELNNEYIIWLKSKERKNANQASYLLDFLYENKNIEFNGSSKYYKKSKKYIKTRDNILKSKNIEVLRIDEINYLKNKDDIIKKCLRFLDVKK